MAAYRQHLARYRPRSTEKLAGVDPDDLASIAARQASSITSIRRDREHLHWRYVDCPYCDDLDVYVTGGSIAAVVRRCVDGDRRFSRILDVFGDLDDVAGLTDLLGTIVRDACRRDDAQIAVFTSLDNLRYAARSAGLRFTSTGRFCWYSENA